MRAQTDNQRLRLGERDVNVLQAVANAIALSTSQIAALFFPSIKKASERLKQLVDAALLAQSRREWGFPDAKVELFYSLTDVGRNQLAETTGKPVPAPPTGQTRNLRHLAGTNQFGIVLSTSLRGTKTLDGTYIPSWALSRMLSRESTSGPGKGLGGRLFGTVKPDAVFMLRNGAGTSLMFMVEIDFDSEPLTRRATPGQVSLVQKLELYCSYFDSGEYQEDGYALFASRFNGFRLLLVTTTEARIAALRNRIADMGDTHFIWATTFERLDAIGVLGTAWQVVAPDETGDKSYSLSQRYEHPSIVRDSGSAK